MRTILIFLLLIWTQVAFSQIDVEQYLLNNSEEINFDEHDHGLPEKFKRDSVVLFGAVHGSSLNQTVDLWLLKSLHKYGYRNYFLEISKSHAYFINKYINDGDLEALDFAINNGYFWRIPQDASIALRNKFIALKEFNDELSTDDRITVYGINDEQGIDLIHIAYLAPDKKTGIPIVDSLKKFRDLSLKFRGSSMEYYNTSPIDKGKYSYQDYLQDMPAILFIDEFKEAYESDPFKITESFGSNKVQFEEIMAALSLNDNLTREQLIFDNFKNSLGKIKNGKVFVSIGFSHVLQEEISDKIYLGKMIKDSLPNVSASSIVTELIDSEYFIRRKYKKGPKVKIKDIELRRKVYKTAENESSERRGVMKFDGRDYLKEINPDKTAVLYDLTQRMTPFASTDLFIGVAKSEKYGWRVKAGATTLDYFQYIIVVRNSVANTPFPKY